MLNATQFPDNVTVGEQYQSLLEKIPLALLNSMPCFTFLYINCVMLYTLRSKPVLRETSRFILLYTLLFADTVQLVLAQLLCLLAFSRIYLTYYVCGILIIPASLTTEVSPLILVVMSLERYVAVCFPLRHAVIVTIRNTGGAVATVLGFIFLNGIIRVSLLSSFPFHELESLQMKETCTAVTFYFVPVCNYYHNTYSCLVFATAAAAIICSYFGVMAAARSASTDKASVIKARNTILLHMVQLCLILSSTLYMPTLTAVMAISDKLVVVRIQNVMYVILIIFPRCLSPLIYGLRDRTIRLTFLKHLFPCSTTCKCDVLGSNMCMHEKRSIVKSDLEIQKL